MRPKKVVLAYSGGLDTSVIAKWLMEEYDLEVVTPLQQTLGRERKQETLGLKQKN